MKSLKRSIHEALVLLDPGLVGCQRRQHWLSGDGPPWRWVRGNALLELFALRTTFYTFCGPLEVYTYHNWLCVYRAGPWNTYWVEDFYDLWSLCKADIASADLSDTILVLHEDKGNLDIKYVPAPTNGEERVARMEADYSTDPRGRISKATAHALKVCRFCPVKTRCDAHDKLKGEDHDWSPHYPIP